MSTDRRTFLASAMALGAPAAASTLPDFSSLRQDFPWTEGQVFFNPAGWHPMPAQSVRAMHRYLDYKLKGPGEGREEWSGGHSNQAKALFAKLINADPDEISFAQSTLMGENIVRAGLGLPDGSSNVVTDELHYEGALYHYMNLQKAGLDLRIVKQKDGRVDVRDMEKVVDKKTRLVAFSLVSCQNGGRADAKAFADLAHAHGAYAYADVIQAAGAVPIDVKALGLDFCACSGYKWLMGDRGLGYLYVRRDLQGRVVKRHQFGDRQFDDFQYHIFPYDSPGPAPVSWKTRSGAGSFYEVGNVANVVAAGHAESFRYIHNLGIDRIQAYVKPMVDRIRKEVPRLGYPLFTPPDSPTPTSSFAVAKPDQLRAKLKKTGVEVKIQWNQTRISVGVYHNQQDVDRLLNALS